jgi:hypothetical protein
MPAGKIALSGGVGPRPYVHFGINIRSLRRYAKPRVAIPGRREAEQLRRYLRDTFEIYALDCATAAPTGTERRTALRGIRNSADLLISMPNLRNAYALLDALETHDYDALNLAYGALRTGGYKPHWLKRRLRHWQILSSVDREAIAAAAKVLATLDIEALVPVSGRFPDPGLAHLVASLIPIWKRVTGRTAGLISTNLVSEDAEGRKRCPFAEWLDEMHDLLGTPRPSVWRVVDIVKWFERSKNPAPFEG